MAASDRGYRTGPQGRCKRPTTGGAFFRRSPSPPGSPGYLAHAEKVRSQFLSLRQVITTDRSAFWNAESMRVSNEANVEDVLTAFHWVGGLIGKEFDSKTALQEPQFRRDQILALHFVNNFHLEAPFSAARAYHRQMGFLPPDQHFDQLYSFLVSAYRIFEQLPPQAHKDFTGKLQGFVSGRFGIRPFAYEFTMAMHLMSKGWDVVFADLEGVGNFDFLARQDGVAIEVECKTTSGDSGRQIHRHEMSRLSSLIQSTLEKLALNPGSHFLKVTIPSKLESSDAALQRIGQAVTEAARQRGETKAPDAEVTYSHRVDLVWSGPHDDRRVHQLCEEILGISNAHLVLRGRPSFSVAVAAFTSERPDTVVATLTKRVKEAADQCSGARPPPSTKDDPSGLET